MLPDLTVMGKVIGGGLPAAAYGGSRELMERIAPAGDVYQAGTLSGNPLAVAAGLATLRLLDERGLPRLAATTRRARPTGLREAAGDRPVQVVARAGPADRLLHRRARRATTRAPGAATSRPTAPGAARCWPAASTRRRRSSRPGSRRSPTPPSTSSARVEAAAAAFAEVALMAALERLARRCGPRAACSPTPSRDGRRRRRRARRPRRRRARAPRPTRRLRAARRGDPRGLPAALRRAARCSHRATADLALLAGDRLYALGLARLADARRPRGGRELADVISLLRAGARGRGPTPQLAGARRRWGMRRRRARPATRRR